MAAEIEKDIHILRHVWQTHGVVAREQRMIEWKVPIDAVALGHLNAGEFRKLDQVIRGACAGDFRTDTDRRILCFDE